MGFEYSWDDDEAQTVLRYTAVGDDWNWNDYHKTVRTALFALHRIGHAVDVVVDLSDTDHLPGGAVAHVRSFGKRQNPNLTGRAVVIGLDRDIERTLTGGSDERVLRFGEQILYFVDDEASAQKVLAALDSGG